MNYFAHGFRFIEDPLFLAGTAMPDWMGVVDRKLRLAPNHLRPSLDDDDPDVRSLVGGILQHHVDDEAFHTGPAFATLQVQFARLIRETDPGAPDLVKYLLAHIVPELMLDAFLIESSPGLVDAYYDSVASLDPHLLVDLVKRLSGKEPSQFPRFFDIFLRERFLIDYADDDRLCYRLRQILNRVGWGPLPNGFEQLVPAMRSMTRSARQDLIFFLGEESPFLDDAP